MRDVCYLRPVVESRRLEPEKAQVCILELDEERPCTSQTSYSIFRKVARANCRHPLKGLPRHTGDIHRQDDFEMIRGARASDSLELERSAGLVRAAGSF